MDQFKRNVKVKMWAEDVGKELFAACLMKL